MEKVPPIESVEASKAARLQRHQARYRDRGGIFKPPEANALLDILLSRNVNGESPSRPRPGPRKSRTPAAQRARARASIAPAPASRKKAARAPRKSVRKPAGRNDEDAAAEDRPRAKKAKARGKARSVPENEDDPQMQLSYAAQLADVINAGRPVPPKSKPRNKNQPAPQPVDTNAAAEAKKKAHPCPATPAPARASGNVLSLEPPEEVDLADVDVVQVIVQRSPHKGTEAELISCTVDEIDAPFDLEPPKPKRGRPKKAVEAKPSASTSRAKKPLSKTNMRLVSEPSPSKAPPRATAPEPEPEPKPQPSKGKGKEKAVPRSLSPILEEGEEEPDMSQSVDVPLAKVVKGKRKADNEVGRETKKRRQAEPVKEVEEDEVVVVPARDTARVVTKARQEEMVDEEDAAVPSKTEAKTAAQTKEQPAKASSSRLEDDVDSCKPAKKGSQASKSQPFEGPEESPLDDEDEDDIPLAEPPKKVKAAKEQKPAKPSSSRLEDDVDGRKPAKKGSRATKAQPFQSQREDPLDDDEDDIPPVELPKKAKAKQGTRAQARQEEDQSDEDEDIRAAEASKKAKGKAKEKQRSVASEPDAERPGKRARDEAVDDLKRGNKKSRVVVREDEEEEEEPRTPIKASKTRTDPKPPRANDIFARVAKEATSVPAVKPIPSPIKRKPPREKPPSKPAPKTRKPPSQRASTKPRSRGPPPSVLKLLAANAARSQVQASEASDDDPIDFLGGAE